MKKKVICLLLSAALAVSVLSGCGDSKEEAPKETNEEQEVVQQTEDDLAEEEMEEESDVEEEGNAETDANTDVDAEAETLDPANRTYETYAVFISEFELEDGILTVKTEDVGIADYPIPKEMEFEFSYPLAEECKWCSDETEVDKELAYKWYDFDLEGALFELDEYYNGHTGYKSGEEVSKAHGLWIFTIVDGEVVEFCQSFKAVREVADVETN